jgi:ABC-2 type transport system permease protein
LKRAGLVLAKDLRVLRRSPVLLGVLIAYPIVIALLVGLVAGYATSKPRVGFVDEEGLPEKIVVGGHTFHVQSTIDRVSANVRLVRLSPAEADRELRTGKVVATITVPRGFVADLKQMVKSPTLILRTTKGGVAPRVNQQVQALVYSLNRQLQDAYIEANLEYVRLILHGGSGTFLGREFDVLGLDGTQRQLDELPRGPRLDRIRRFVEVARLALAQTGDALEATAHPIELREAPEEGRTWALSAQVQAHALALTISFLTLLLAAGALAAERDENAIGRLVRGLVSLGQLVAAKVALAVAVALAVGLALLVGFGIAVEVANVTGGQPWQRLPLVLVGVALAGAAVGAVGTLVGALARESRTASLVGVLVVLPVVFLGLVPREIVPAAAWTSDAFPFAHAVRFFASALYDGSPWTTLGREAGWLIALGAAFGVLARLSARRLTA